MEACNIVFDVTLMYRITPTQSISQSIKSNLYSTSYKYWTKALNNKTIKYVAVN